jgi:hypothetical protein
VKLQSKTRVTEDRVDEILRAVAELTGREVMIGVPSTSADRENDPLNSPLNNAEIGYIQEYGSPVANIPARPHLVPGVQSVQAQVVTELRRAGGSAIDGNENAVQRAFTKIGLMCQNAVRGMIYNGLAPLSAATLRRRKTRLIAPRQGETPLVDLGIYRRSLTFVVRDRT